MKSNTQEESRGDAHDKKGEEAGRSNRVGLKARVWGGGAERSREALGSRRDWKGDC